MKTLQESFSDLGLNFETTMRIANSDGLGPSSMHTLESTSDDAPLTEAKKIVRNRLTGKKMVWNMKTGADLAKSRRANKAYTRANKGKIARRRKKRAKSALGKKIAIKQAAFAAKNESQAGKVRSSRTLSAMETALGATVAEATQTKPGVLSRMFESTANPKGFAGHEAYVSFAESIKLGFAILAERMEECGRDQDAGDLISCANEATALKADILGSATKATADVTCESLLRKFTTAMKLYESPEFTKEYLAAVVPSPLG